MKKKTVKIVSISVAILIVIVLIFAKAKRVSPLSWRMHQPVNQPMFSDVAINKYDPVGYFTEREAIKGSEQYIYRWNDADWYFTSEGHKKLFVENPEKYAPRFGGYCAFAVSKGFTANTDPNTFEVIDGKLYLFADNQMKNDWMEHPEENLAKCEKYWE